MTTYDKETVELVLNAVRQDPDDHGKRLMYAEALDDAGDDLMASVVRMQVQYGLPFATTPVLGTTLEEMSDDEEWQEVFGQGDEYGCTPHVDACPPNTQVDLTPPNIEDIAEVYAVASGERGESEWVGLFRLKDGRFIAVTGDCCYTGWCCNGRSSIEVSSSIDDAVCFGLEKKAIARLWKA